MFKKLISLAVIFCFLLSTLTAVPCAHADSILGLPAPGAMVIISAAYQPVIIRGLTVHKENPFLFDFIVDVGQDKVSGNFLRQEGERLIKYFLASLAIPDKEVWVNLSPYEKDKMIPDALGQTDMGRDLLKQDYILKQLTASLIYPEKDLGKKFWDSVYAKAQQMYGTTQIPVNTFNKVWILADRAEVFEHGQTAFVVDSHLKVMLEEDYLALRKHAGPQQTHSIASSIVRSVILPAIEKEVNTGKNFANLRQIFNSIILASWYKRSLKQALLNQIYTDQSKVRGIDLHDPTIKGKIYQQYLQAYKKGVFNYIKEDVVNGEAIPKKYFSGGILGEGAASPERLVVDTDLAMGAEKMAKGDWKNGQVIIQAGMKTGVSQSKVKGGADSAMIATKQNVEGVMNGDSVQRVLKANGLTLIGVSEDARFVTVKVGRAMAQSVDKITPALAQAINLRRFSNFIIQPRIGSSEILILFPRVTLQTDIADLDAFNFLQVGRLKEAGISTVQDVLDETETGLRTGGFRIGDATMQRLRDKLKAHGFKLPVDRAALAQNPAADEGKAVTVIEMPQKDLERMMDVFDRVLDRRANIVNIWNNGTKIAAQKLRALAKAVDQGDAFGDEFKGEFFKTAGNGRSYARHGRFENRLPEREGFFSDKSPYTAGRLIKEAREEGMSFKETAGVILNYGLLGYLMQLALWSMESEKPAENMAHVQDLLNKLQNEGNSKPFYFVRDGVSLAELAMSQVQPSKRYVEFTDKISEKSFSDVRVKIRFLATNILANLQHIKYSLIVNEDTETRSANLADYYQIFSNLTGLLELYGNIEHQPGWDYEKMLVAEALLLAMHYDPDVFDSNLDYSDFKDTNSYRPDSPHTNMVQVMFDNTGLLDERNLDSEMALSDIDIMEQRAVIYYQKRSVYAGTLNPLVEKIVSTVPFDQSPYGTLAVFPHRTILGTVIMYAQKWRKPVKPFYYEDTLSMVQPDGSLRRQTKSEREFVANVAYAGGEGIEINKPNDWNTKRISNKDFLNQKNVPSEASFKAVLGMAEKIPSGTKVTTEEIVKGASSLLVPAEANAVLGLLSDWEFQPETGVWEKKTDEAMSTSPHLKGGIDLNTSNGMQWKVSKDGHGVKMDTDPAMIAQIKAQGIDGLVPVIFKVTPVASVWSLAGVSA